MMDRRLFLSTSIAGAAAGSMLSRATWAAGTDRLSRDLAHEVQTSVVRRLRGGYGEAKVTDLGTKTALF